MAKQQQVKLEDFVRQYNAKIEQYGDQIRAAGANPLQPDEVAGKVQQVAVKTVPAQTVVANDNNGPTRAQELWEAARRRAEAASQAAKDALARRQEEATTRQITNQAQPVLERPYFQRGGARTTLIMGAFFGDVLASSIWFFGALTSLQLLRGIGLKSVDNAPWNWIVWILLAGVTSFEVGYMPNFRHFVAALKREWPLVLFWFLIAAVDMGSNFFDLLGVLSGKTIPLFIFQVEFTGWTLLITSFILSGLVAFGPEPLVRYFTRTIRDLLGW